MESKPTIMNGGVEAPSSAQEIIDTFLAEELAAIEPKTATPAAADAVPPAKPEPTQEEVDAYLEKLEKDRKGVSPFGYDKAQVERAEDEMQANNRIAGRSKEDPLIVLPEEGKIDGADPSLSLGVADPGEDGEDLKTNMDAAVDDPGVTTSLPLPTIEPSSIIETGKKSRKKKSVPSSAPAAPDVTGSTAQVGEPDPKPVSSEAGRFKLPKIKKGESIKLRAPDGTVHTLAHKASGYWISKEGDSKEASIALSSARQHAKDGGWVLLKEGSGVVGAEPDAQAPSPDAAATPKADPIEPDAATTVPQAEPLPQPSVVPRVEPIQTPEPLPILNGVDIATALVLLDAGSKLVYRRENGTEIRVQKESEQYWVYEKDDSGFVTVDALGLEDMAEREGWQSVEALPLLGAQGEAKPDVAEQDAKIAKFREAVTAARTAFITAEESQGSSWKKLMQTFRTLKHRESDDHDIQAYHNAYDQAVLALLAAELEKLKQSGLSLQQLRPEMAALIRESQFDEAERIYTERRQQRLEKTNQSLGEKLDARWKETIGSLEAEAGKGEKWKQYIKYFLGASATLGKAAAQGIEKLGQANNEFSKKYGKYILIATVTVGGAVALGAATGGVASVAIGGLALKRLLGGAGLAVGLEGGMNYLVNTRRDKKRERVEVDQAGFFRAMEDEQETREVAAIAKGETMSQEVDLSQLEVFLKAEAAKARKGEGARRRNELLRKSGAVFAGALLGSGALSHLAHGYFSGSTQAALETAPTAGGPVAEASIPQSGTIPIEQAVPDTAVGGPQGGVAPTIDGAARTGIPLDFVSDGAEGAPTVPSTEQSLGLTDKAKDFIASHDVKRGDSIWKLAKGAVKDVPDMDERASNRFAKLVELKL
ncbi:MAG: hypothetical protein WBO92_01215, partial [Candidatus Moraniibacteriota bacterium]